MRIAVVGAGIFGCTTAVHLAREGHDVTLFDRYSAILNGASGINQYRLHRGYHYPRSEDTALASKRSEQQFRDAYKDAVVEDVPHHYAIANRDTKTNVAQFVTFCNRLGLDLEEEWSPALNRGSIEGCFKVRETLFDPRTLRLLCMRDLDGSGVRTSLSTEIRPEDLRPFDFKVLATYSTLNALLPPRSESRRPYQFEVCEKPVFAPPPALRGKSVVVIDGPFMCIDPLGRSGLSVMGHVVEAIHHSSVGLLPEVPVGLQPFLDKGVVEARSISRFSRFIEAAREFFVQVDRLEYVGSMFTVRTVLPGVDQTDERPTLVEKVSADTVVLFSGKVGTCIEAARNVVAIAGEESYRATGAIRRTT